MKLPHIFFSIALLALINADRLRAQAKSTQEVVGSNGATPFALRAVNFSEVGLIGSPLMVPRWVPGEITLGSGKYLTTNLLNYDVFEHQVTVLLSPRDSVRYQGTVVKELILRPAVNQLPLLFRHFPEVVSDEPALKTELLRVVHQGTYSLVELPIRRFIEAPKKQAYGGQGAVSNEFRDESVFYLIRPDHTAERVKLTRKSLVGALKDKGALFDTYLKTNQLDPKKESEAAQALASLDVAK